MLTQIELARTELPVAKDKGNRSVGLVASFDQDLQQDLVSGRGQREILYDFAAQEEIARQRILGSRDQPRRPYADLRNQFAVPGPLLDLAGLDKGERTMIQASIGNARDFV